MPQPRSFLVSSPVLPPPFGRARRAWPAPVLASVLATMLAIAPQTPVRAQAASPPLPVAVNELEGITEYRLPNGLQLLLFPDANSTTTTVNVVYRVGSVHEAQGESGMAHLLEHMLFKGTPTHPDIPVALGQRGVRWNATTSLERTNYFSSFNAQPETLDFVLGLEADRMLNATVARAALDREMTVVRNEFERGESNAIAALQQRVAAVAHAWHAYGRPVIGARSDIEGVDITRLQAFYKRHYRPDLATVMVAGRFDVDATLARLSAVFGSLPRPAEPPPVLMRTAEPVQDGERRVAVMRVGERPTLWAQWHIPAMTHPDAPALTVLGNLLTAQPGGPLYQRLVESKRAVAAVANASASVDRGSFQVLAVADGQLGEVAKTVFDIVEGRDRAPFEAAELERVRQQWLAGYAMLLKKPEAVVMVLTEFVPMGDWRAVFALVQRVQAVTLADVNRVAAAYLKPSNRSWGEYVPTAQPDRTVVPPAPPVAEMLAGLQMKSTVSAGERFDATPENLESRTLRTILPSGIQLGMLRKQNRGDAVTLTMEAEWGKLGPALTARGGHAAVGRLIFEGSSTRSRQAQQDELTRMRADVQLRSSAQGWRLTLSTERDQLLPALALVADALQNPLLPTEALERDRGQQVSALQASRQRPATVLADAWRHHLNTALGLTPQDWWDPRYASSLDDDMSRVLRVSADEVRAIHRELWSASGARVGVVGSLPEGLEAAIEQHFGPWKKTVPAFERFTARHQDVPGKQFTVELKDQANAELHMFSHFALNQRHPDFMPLRLATQILGGDPLDSRLAARVRQRDGLSYGVSAQLYSGYFDDRASLRISGSFAPENRDRMLAAISAELERARLEGFTEAELLRARKSLLESRRMARAQDSTLADELLWQAAQRKTFAELSENDARLNAATLAQVNAAFRQYVQAPAFITGVVGSFSGKVQNLVQP